MIMIFNILDEINVFIFYSWHLTKDDDKLDKIKESDKLKKSIEYKQPYIIFKPKQKNKIFTLLKK